MRKFKPHILVLLTIIFSILIFPSTLLLLPSCKGGIINLNFTNPNIITNNSGESFLTYQIISEDTTNIYVQRLDSEGNFIWKDKGTFLYSQSGIVYNKPLLLESDNDSIIILCVKSDNISVKKIDSNGNLLWDTDDISTSGIASSEKVISDDSGGVVIAWLHNSNLYIQRIDSQGNILWYADHLLSNIYFFDISSDNQGNTFLVIEDKNFNVYTQKVDPAGTMDWDNNGALISTQDKPGVGMSKIVSDDDGSSVITWVCSTRNENKSSYSNPEVYAQKVDINGNILWQNGGVPVYTEDEMTNISEPRIIASENGSTIIIWRNGLDLYGQRIDANGNILWEDNGIEIWSGGNIQGSANTNVVSDNNGGIIVVWCYTPEGSYTDNDMVIRAQRVSIDGQNLWGDEGVKFSNDSTNYSYLPLIAQYGDGGIIAVWEAGRNVNDTGSAYMQKISPDGELLWGDGGIKISN